MTAFSKVTTGKFSSRFNRKDGRRRNCPTFAPTGFWGRTGFIPTAPGRWEYTNVSIKNCPVFSISETLGGIIACLDDGNEVIRSFGPKDHGQVKRWLDDQILIAKRFEDEESPLNWQPAGEEIDIDAFMVAV